MGAVSKGNWPVFPDNLTQDYLAPYAFASVGIAVQVWDAMYYKGTVAGGDVAYPADQLASLGAEALDQLQFARLFVGYSQQQILLAEVNATKRLVVRADGVLSCVCPSQAWKHGDLVGIYSNGVVIDPQQVDKVVNPAQAIGVCVKDQASPSTRVVFRFQSRVADSFGASAAALSLFDGQAMSAANVLTDANQIFTVGAPFFSTMANTSARTVKLPPEAPSKGLAFFLANLAASAGSASFLGSAGGAVLGNGAVPAGKSGFAYCDGVNWYGFVSA